MNNQLPPHPLLPNKLSRTWEILLVVAIVGTFAAAAIPAFSDPDYGAQPNPRATQQLLMAALLPYFLARVKKWDRPWLFALVGLLSMTAIYFASGFARGQSVKAADQQLEERMLLAIESFDADLGAKARAAKADTAATQLIMRDGIRQATMRATDAAVVSFATVTTHWILTHNGLNLNRCNQMLEGKQPSDMTSTEARVYAENIAALFESAAKSRTAIDIDVARAESIITGIRQEADPSDLLSAPLQPGEADTRARCDVFLQLIEKLRALPNADEALVYRYNLAAS